MILHEHRQVGLGRERQQRYELFCLAKSVTEKLNSGVRLVAPRGLHMNITQPIGTVPVT
jgi:hypothetical protein